MRPSMLAQRNGEWRYLEFLQVTRYWRLCCCGRGGRAPVRWCAGGARCAY